MWWYYSVCIYLLSSKSCNYKNMEASKDVGKRGVLPELFSNPNSILTSALWNKSWVIALKRKNAFFHCGRCRHRATTVDFTDTLAAHFKLWPNSELPNPSYVSFTQIALDHAMPFCMIPGTLETNGTVNWNVCLYYSGMTTTTPWEKIYNIGTLSNFLYVWWWPWDDTVHKIAANASGKLPQGLVVIPGHSLESQMTAQLHTD